MNQGDPFARIFVKDGIIFGEPVRYASIKFNENGTYSARFKKIVPESARPILSIREYKNLSNEHQPGAA